MTRPPLRWSDGASDADPVLRAMVRYAQSIEPSRADVASCAAVVARAESHAARTSSVRRPVRAWSRRTLPLVAALLGVLIAGAALGMTWVPWWRERHERLASPTMSTRPPSLPAPQSRPSSFAQPGSTQEPPVPSAPPPVASGNSTRAKVATASPIAGAPPTDATEIELLSAARKELRMHSTRALSLLAAHARHFPSSSFAEERAALRVEALFSLGRTAEAEREYASFIASFPDSIYGLRLSAKRARP